jgi:NitT/TauT family transport system substrate-binding protein
MHRTFALLLGLIAASIWSNANAESLKVAVAQRGFWDSTMVDIAEKQGFFKEAGLEIEVLYTEGGASTLTPLLAGSIDVAMSNGILGVIGAYSKGAPVRIISAEGTGAADAFWYAPTASGIKSLNDTNGKTVAFSSPGSSTNLILLQLVKQAGTSPKLVPTGGAPATYTQVMTGQIDVGWSVPPFALKDLQEGKIAIIARGNDVEAIKAQTVRVNVANANALKQKREAFVSYVKALARAVDWAYSSPDALSNYAAIARVPVDQAKMTRDEFYPKEALQLAEIKGIDVTLQQALDFKYVTKPMTKEDVAPLFDLLAAEKR